jgi:hypothetical protein
MDALYYNLVGGLESWNFICFPIQLGSSSSQLTKSIIFQRGRAQGPTSNEKSPSKIWFLDLGDKIVE